jgi:hypothetical protein
MCVSRCTRVYVCVCVCVYPLSLIVCAGECGVHVHLYVFECVVCVDAWCDCAWCDWFRCHSKHGELPKKRLIFRCRPFK